MPPYMRSQHTVTHNVCISPFGDPHLSWVFPSSTGGKGRGGKVDVLWSVVWRTGLREGTAAGDLAWDVVEDVRGWILSVWGAGGGGTWVAEPAGTVGEGWEGADGVVEEVGTGTAARSSPLETSWGNCVGGGGRGSAAAAESLSCGGASALAGREEDRPVDFRADGGGEAAPLLARAAASAAWRSFFLRLSSAPRLELSGSREEGGERLAGRLLWELPPATPEETCLLLRDREEERRDEV